MIHYRLHLTLEQTPSHKQMITWTAIPSAQLNVHCTGWAKKSTQLAFVWTSSNFQQIW